MESLIADISDLKLEEKYKRFNKDISYIAALYYPANDDALRGNFFGDNVWDFIKMYHDEEKEQKIKDELEAKIPEAELEDVQLRYIPEYILELRNKRNYWKKEYKYWNDLISEKNWKNYEKELKEEIIKLKTVTKNLDMMLLQMKHLENHLSHSLDPERVQTLVDYIKEKESNNNVLQAMYSAAYFDQDYTQIAYVQYAIHARYGEFRLYPKRPSSFHSG